MAKKKKKQNQVLKKQAIRNDEIASAASRPRNDEVS